MNDMNEPVNDMDPVDYKDFADRSTSLLSYYAVSLVNAVVNGKELTQKAQKFDEDAVNIFDKTGQLFFAKLRSQNLPDAFIDETHIAIWAIQSI
jgi:hypothetical protein